MKIDPRQLINLLAISEHGSFNRAAASIGLSQPALSSSIAQLERRLGFAVLDRTRRGSEVNEYGRILLQGAHTVDAVLTQISEQVRLKRLGVDGPLRVGATPSMTLKFIPDVMAALLKDQQPMQIHLVDGLDDQLLPALQRGELDLVFAPESGTALPRELLEESLFSDAFSIGIGPKSPLAKRRSVSLSELQDFPWVLPVPGSAYRRYTEALFLAAGLSWPANAVFNSNLHLVESLVTQANRVTLATELQVLRHNFWRMRSVPLKGGGRRTMSVKWRRAGSLPALGKRIIQIAHELALSLHKG